MSFEIRLPDLALDANKYSRGKLVIVAGSERYPGAAVLAARASQRMGAGYTEVVTDDRVVDVVRSSSPSLVVRPLSTWSVAELPESRPGRPCAVCIGPGFAGSERVASDAVAGVLGVARCPVVVDGGALPVLASAAGLERLSMRADGGWPTVITPHGGEAARLSRALSLACSEPEALAAALAAALHVVVVLKGPDTFVSDGANTLVMTEGTPALAKAGTGDVLAGMVGALLAQGAEPIQAALTAATVHARAGVLAAEALTAVSVTAEDVIDCIAPVIRRLEPCSGG